MKTEEVQKLLSDAIDKAWHSPGIAICNLAEAICIMNSTPELVPPLRCAGGDPDFHVWHQGALEGDKCQCGQRTLMVTEKKPLTLTINQALTLASLKFHVESAFTGTMGHFEEVCKDNEIVWLIGDFEIRRRK